VSDHRTINILEPGRPEAVLIDMPAAHTAVANVYVGSGSARETAEKNGISHLIEHAVLAGTEHYPSREVLQRAIDATGGYIDAVTHKEYTEYSFQCFPDEVTRALELLAEALVRPTFSKEAVESERQIVLEEMLSGTYEGGSDPFTQMLWGSDSLGLPIIGKEQTVKALTEKDIRAYFARTYHAANMVVAVAGPVSEAAVRKGLQAFAGMPAGGDTPEPASAKVQSRPEFTFDRYRSASIDCCLLFRTPGWKHDDTRLHTTLNLVTQVFQTEIYQHLVGPELPVYYVYTGQEIFVPQGYIYVYVNATKERFFPTLERLLKELDAFMGRRVSGEDLGVHKRRYELQVLSTLDDPHGMAERVGSDRLLCGRERAVDLEQELKQVRTIEPDEFARAVRETMIPARLNVIVRGGINWLQERRLRRRLEAWLGTS